MRRRGFIALLAGAAAWPVAARAQQAPKVPRVGVLSPAASESAGTLTAFREAIRDLGYVEGQTIALDFRLSKGSTEALPALATELVRIPVNVIVTDTTKATFAAFAATRTIPIVMATTSEDLVARGLVKSFARPAGNVTGTFLPVLSDKRLQLLKQAFPGAQQIVALANPNNMMSLVEMTDAEIARARLGLRSVDPLTASTTAELRAVLPAALSTSDGLLVLPDAIFWNNRATIIGLVATARVPAIYPEREYADDGGLITYGPNAPEHFRLAARYVDRILRGANPGDLPIEVSPKIDFVINLRAARALQFSLPPDFVSVANEVIE